VPCEQKFCPIAAVRRPLMISWKTMKIHCELGNCLGRRLPNEAQKNLQQVAAESLKHPPDAQAQCKQ